MNLLSVNRTPSRFFQIHYPFSQHKLPPLLLPYSFVSLLWVLMRTAIKCVIKQGRLGESDEIMDLKRLRCQNQEVAGDRRRQNKRKESEEEGDRGGVIRWQANPVPREGSGAGREKRARGQYAGGGVETSSAQVLPLAQLSSFRRYHDDERGRNKKSI